MTEKTYTIVGVSTQGKITKFRVANGSVAERVKILERAGCTDINFIELPQAMGKIEAIEAYKAQHPEAAGIRMPNAKDPAKSPTKTVSVRRAGTRKVADAAQELLRAVEESQ